MPEDGASPEPVQILRNTSETHSLIRTGVLPFSKQTYCGSDILVWGVTMSVLRLPFVSGPCTSWSAVPVVIRERCSGRESVPPLKLSKTPLLIRATHHTFSLQLFFVVCLFLPPQTFCDPSNLRLMPVVTGRGR